MYACVCVHACMCGVYVCMYVWVHIHMCVHACMCVQIHIISVCVCMCVCVHIRNLKLITRSILHYFSTLFPEAGPHSQTQRSPIWPVILDCLLCGSYLSFFKARIT